MFVGAAYDWPGVPNKLLTFRRHNRKDLNSKSTRDGGGSDMGDRLRRLAAVRLKACGLAPVAIFRVGCGLTPQPGRALPRRAQPRGNGRTRLAVGRAAT